MHHLSTFPHFADIRRTFPELGGILFDMDGTLFKTEEVHAEALKSMAAHWRIRPPFPPEEIQERLKGMADHQVLELAKSWPGFPVDLDVRAFVEEKNRRVIELLKTLPLASWGAHQFKAFLAEAKREKLRLAIVTSSERAVTDALVEAAGLASSFDLIITLQDVTHPKPHPAPYLMAMERLGLAPSATLIFEDSAPGLAAARASGAHAVEVSWWD